MTTPPTGGTLGGGFESGDDFIAARVSIDIPTEGIAGLREITQEMDRFRTSVEAANRSSETFSSYLLRIAEAASQAATAQENLVQLFEQSVEMQNSAVTGGMPQLNASPQYSDPFDGATLGMGTGGGHGGGGIADVNTQLEELRTQNPRAYVNKMAASGQYRMGDIAASSPTGVDIQNAASRISQRAQLTSEGEAGLGNMGDIGSRAGRMGAIAQQVLNEISPGTNPLGVSGLIQKGIGAMGASAAGSALGTGIGRLAGVAAGPIGMALAGYGLVQGAGGIYQDYKNMGSVRGGGAMEGVGYEMSIRAMAMNPFISGDQSRQIIQQGLRDGYTGKEFDTVTGMVAQNLKEFNMQISDSFALVRKNVMEGGQSMVGLASALGMIKDMSQTGYRSMPELAASYAQTSSSLISAGMPGSGASEAALLSGQMFKNNPALAGTFDGITQAFANSPQNMAIMKYQGGVSAPAGLMPGAMPMMMGGEAGGQAMVGGATETLRKFAMMAYRAAGNPPVGSVKYYNAAYMWQMRMQQMGMPFASDATKSEQMFRSFVSGENPLGDANKEVDKAATDQTKVEQRNPLSMTGGGLVSLGAAVGNTVLDTLHQAGGSIADVFTGNAGNLDDRWKGWWKHGDDLAGSVASAFSPYRMKGLEAIQNQYGATGYEILDENHNVVKDFSPTNITAMKRLESGDYKWRPKGDQGQGFTIRETPTASADSIKQYAGAGVGGGRTEVSGAVTITLTPEAQKLLQVQGGSNKVELTPHEAQANAGYGQATPNNAPPGYDRPRR